MVAGNDKEPTSKLDERTLENMRIAEKIGPDSFEENTHILRRMAWRGVRAFMIGSLGLAAFAFAMRRRRLQKENNEIIKGINEDPTQRYLEEMRGLGFDVDTLEEELEAERKARNKM